MIGRYLILHIQAWSRARLCTLAALVAALYSVALGQALYQLHGGFVGSESYVRIAREFLSGGFETTYRPPVYPLVVAALLKLEALGLFGSLH